MTNFLSKFKEFNKNKTQSIDSLLKKQYDIDIDSIPIVADFDVTVNNSEKKLIIEKLIEAHILAVANVEAGNITTRGFATNVCDNEYNWTLGTNFNNTRNDISSICGERTAILGAYNKALMNFAENSDKKFDFKIKYLCMATNVSLNEPQKTIAPCEDCLSWLNTNKYFDNNTIIFSFERDENNILKLYATKLSNLLPYRNIVTSAKNIIGNRYELSKRAGEIILDKNSKFKIIELISKTQSAYKKNEFSKTSNQNIACSIYVNDEIITSSKIDWTRRWNVEPLELCAAKAIEKFGSDMEIKAICYFGDEFTASNYKIKDGVVSIKSLGRIRQKYASNDTLLILNLKDGIFVLTLGEYLPKKFVQGYKIV